MGLHAGPRNFETLLVKLVPFAPCSKDALVKRKG